MAHEVIEIRVQLIDARLYHRFINRCTTTQRGAQTFDRWQAILNARAAGVTDPAKLRDIARDA